MSDVGYGMTAVSNRVSTVQDAGRRPQVTEEMDLLEKEIAGLEDVLTKLNPLLAPQAPKDVNGSGTPSGGLAPLAEQLKMLRAKVRRAINFVSLLEI